MGYPVLGNVRTKYAIYINLDIKLTIIIGCYEKFATWFLYV